MVRCPKQEKQELDSLRERRAEREMTEFHSLWGWRVEIAQALQFLQAGNWNCGNNEVSNTNIATGLLD